MKILEILAHPSAGSFNHAIAQTALETLAKQGHEVFYHDLYAEGFDPAWGASDADGTDALDPLVKRYADELGMADGIVIVHPSWWGQPPAIMKGWIDRVFRSGMAFRFETTPSGEGIAHGLLKARHAIVFNTANSAVNAEWGGFGDPLENLWRNTVLGFCGVPDVRHRVYAPVIVSTPEQRAEWLKDAEVSVDELFRLVHA